MHLRHHTLTAYKWNRRCGDRTEARQRLDRFGILSGLPMSQLSSITTNWNDRRILARRVHERQVPATVNLAGFCSLLTRDNKPLRGTTSTSYPCTGETEIPLVEIEGKRISDKSHVVAGKCV